MIVIGNGQSRQTINLNNLTGQKIGCNAIIRDTHVDYLVCCDKKMVRQALQQNFSPIYTRSRWSDDFDSVNVQSLPELPYKGEDRKDDPFNWGSGPYAILLACNLQKTKPTATNIKLVGFDLYGLDGKLNNMYANTNGYKDADEEQVDWSYWEYQIAKIFERYPYLKFTIYNLDGWKCPKTWNFKNLKVDILENL
jgi:hypothetical protein